MSRFFRSNLFVFDLISLVFVLCLLTKQPSLVEADFYDTNENCPNLAQSLGDGCSVNDDCTKITCSKRFVDEVITLTLDIDKCGDPVTVTARMQVPDLGIDWSHKYSSDDIVKVPGFTANIPGMSAGVYVQIHLDSRDTSQLNMKVKLLAGASVLGHATYPIKTTILSGDLPIETSECGSSSQARRVVILSGIVRWWRELGTTLQVVIILVPVAVFISIVLCCCCCCCACCSSSKPSAGQAIVVVPGTQPNPAVMTTTNSRVPMKPLENMA